MWIALAGLALAAPPSSTLTGPDGTLSWTVSDAGSTLKLHGTSPKWEVAHEAEGDFTPVRTVRRNPDGSTVTVDYRDDGATVQLGGKTLEIAQAGLWDGDTLDVRLGHLVAAGRTEVQFSAVDTGSGKVYGFDSQLEGKETCGARACTHLVVRLRGVLRWVGPEFHYWFGDDGQLLRFEGPAGKFRADGV